jgi:CcmD family protein
MSAGVRKAGAVALVVCCLLGASVPALLALQPAQPPAGQDEFVPVGQLPVQEQLPAAPLLIAAYAFLWVMLLLYVVMLWRRLAKVEQEIASVSRQVEEKRRA